MASTFEKSVKGATKIKLAPPKAKYVEHILLGTSSGEAGVAEVFRTLQNRLRDSTWTIVFKALIVVHLMIKDGTKDVTLSYLAANPRNRLALNSFTDVQTQGQNIRRYSEYLLARTLAFADTKVDYCKVGALERMKSLSIDKGLLRETGAIQDQIRALLKCDFFSRESENDIALMAFRLITQDLLDLYAAMNQAVMNVLSRYFELSRVDAERGITLYKTFTKQTDQVVRYLSIARSYENVTRLEIPNIKHAPTSLTKSLEEYLNDTNFDTNRRQYLAAQQGRKGTKFEGKSMFDEASESSKPAASSSSASKPTESSSTTQAAPASQAKGPAPDLIDFFDSIEQQQQPMAQPAPDQLPPQQPMMTGMPTGQMAYPQMGNGFDQQPTGTNPFGQYMQQPPQPMNPQYTGMGFGGYGPQPPQQFVQPNGQYQDMSQQQTGMTHMNPQQTAQPMQQQPQQLVPQSTNPFRQSMVYPQNTISPTSPQSTNPYQRMSMANTLNGIPEQQQPPQQMEPQQTGGFGQQELPQFQSQAPIQLQRTGTNPFAKQPQQTGQSQSSTPSALTPMVTGSTNPFRQSMFVNQQTGRGWQNNQQTTMGGLEQMETVPVFPRPGQ
ncbi:ANTH domain-containing protein [Elsinoe fawcettii]|nr:ANTH domain-containing protein [Elsinoe fawcettii]